MPAAAELTLVRSMRELPVTLLTVIGAVLQNPGSIDVTLESVRERHLTRLIALCVPGHDQINSFVHMGDIR